MPALPREHKKVALCRLMPDDEQSDSMIAACSAISKAAASVHAACYPDQGTTDRGEDADTATGAVKLGKLGSLVELGHHTYHAPPGAAVVTDFDGFLSKSATAMMDTLHAQVNQYMPVQQPATFTGPPDQAQADPTWGTGGVFGHSLLRNHGFGSTNVGPGTGAGGEEHPGSVNFNSIMKMGAQSCSAEQTWWEKASAGPDWAALGTEALEGGPDWGAAVNEIKAGLKGPQPGGGKWKLLGPTHYAERLNLDPPAWGSFNRGAPNPLSIRRFIDVDMTEGATPEIAARKFLYGQSDAPGHLATRAAAEPVPPSWDTPPPDPDDTLEQLDPDQYSLFKGTTLLPKLPASVYGQLEDAAGDYLEATGDAPMRRDLIEGDLENASGATPWNPDWNEMPVARSVGHQLHRHALYNKYFGKPYPGKFRPGQDGYNPSAKWMLEQLKKHGPGDWTMAQYTEPEWGDSRTRSVVGDNLDQDYEHPNMKAWTDLMRGSIEDRGAGLQGEASATLHAPETIGRAPTPVADDDVPIWSYSRQGETSSHWPPREEASMDPLRGQLGASDASGPGMQKANADSTLPTAQPLPTQPKQIQPQPTPQSATPPAYWHGELSPYAHGGWKPQGDALRQVHATTFDTPGMLSSSERDAYKQFVDMVAGKGNEAQWRWSDKNRVKMTPDGRMEVAMRGDPSSHITGKLPPGVVDQEGAERFARNQVLPRLSVWQRHLVNKPKSYAPVWQSMRTKEVPGQEPWNVHTFGLPSAGQQGLQPVQLPSMGASDASGPGPPAMEKTQSCSAEQTWWEKASADYGIGPFKLDQRNKVDQPPWASIPTDMDKVRASRHTLKPTRDMLAKNYTPEVTHKLKRRVHGGALRVPHIKNILGQWNAYRQANPGTPASGLAAGMWKNIQRQMPYKAPTAAVGPSARYMPGTVSGAAEGVLLPSDPTYYPDLLKHWKIDKSPDTEGVQSALSPMFFAHEQTHGHSDLPADMLRSDLGVEWPAVLTDMLTTTQGYNQATGRRATGRAISDDMVTDKGDYNPKAQWMADMAKKHVRLGTGDIVKELNTPAGQRWTRQFLDTLSLPPRDPKADKYGLVWPESMRGLEKTNAALQPQQYKELEEAGVSPQTGLKWPVPVHPQMQSAPMQKANADLNPTAVGEGDYTKLKCVPYNSYGGDASGPGMQKANTDSTLLIAQPLPTQPKQIQPQSMIGSPDDTQQMLASSMGAVAGPASAYSALIGD